MSEEPPRPEHEDPPPGSEPPPLPNPFVDEGYSLTEEPEDEEDEPAD